MGTTETQQSINCDATNRCKLRHNRIFLRFDYRLPVMKPLLKKT